MNKVIFIMEIILVILIVNGHFTDKQTSPMTIKYDQSTCSINKCGNFLCGVNGKCNDNKECICNKGFTSKDNDSIIRCCYKQKSLITVILFETLIGFGFGHLFLGNMTLFYIKFFTYLILGSLSLIVLLYWFYAKEKKGFWFKAIRSYIFLSFFAVIIGWHIADPVIFLLGGYIDPNGVELY